MRWRFVFEQQAQVVLVDVGLTENLIHVCASVRLGRFLIRAGQGSRSPPGLVDAAATGKVSRLPNLRSESVSRSPCR
jgi:hypothetical protein